MINGWYGTTFKRYYETSGGCSLVRWCWLFLFLLSGFPPWQSVCLADAESDAEQVYLIVLDTMINPAVADFIHESIARSSREGGRALIIQLDTPGGLLNSTKSIVKDILGAPLPVIVYVGPSGASAGSAGVFITMAGHIAAMAPGTTIGAAHPVAGGGQNIEGDMREKIENFTASFSESIAQRRGRNVEWAEKAVRESVAITETEALDKHVIDLIANDIQDLLTKVNGRKVEVANMPSALDLTSAQTADGTFRVMQIDMRLKHKILNILADPNIAYLLMMAGILGLYLEFTHPGMIFPGIVGGICLLLAFAAFQVLPINYTGLLLLIFGIGLLITELFLPAFGIFGFGGIVAFVLGSLFLFDTSDPGVIVDRGIVSAVAVSSAIAMFTIGTLAVRALRQRPVMGVEGIIGEIGEVRIRLDPRGKVWLHGEYWNAESEEDLDVGQKVEVIGIKDLLLQVRKAPR
ncbi:MAG: nodulation protein NfeD [Candidatus Binatia bacterium]